MATETEPLQTPLLQPAVVLPLYNGDRLNQAEFHRRYEQYPDNFKFELIGGVVYMASPTGLPHGQYDSELGGLFVVYKGSTPGVETASNATVVLDADSEVQPDQLLFARPECGGRVGLKDNKYLTGAPELVAEIAHSSVSIDLHAKREDYRRAGVLEYIVVCIDEKKVRMFDLASDEELTTGNDGIFRSRAFPGLWIEIEALIERNTKRLLDVLQHGLSSAEHRQFVQKLSKAQAK